MLKLVVRLTSCQCSSLRLQRTAGARFSYPNRSEDRQASVLAQKLKDWKSFDGNDMLRTG